MPRRILSNDLNAADGSLEGVNVRCTITLRRRRRSRHLGIEILHDCRNGTKGSPARRCSHTRKPPEGYTCLPAGEDGISASSADMPAAAA